LSSRQKKTSRGSIDAPESGEQRGKERGKTRHRERRKRVVSVGGGHGWWLCCSRESLERQGRAKSAGEAAKAAGSSRIIYTTVVTKVDTPKNSWDIL
jgi:hypothetical protein